MNMMNGRIWSVTLKINIKVVIVTSPQLLKNQEICDDLGVFVLNLQFPLEKIKIPNHVIETGIKVGTNRCKWSLWQVWW